MKMSVDDPTGRCRARQYFDHVCGGVAVTELGPEQYPCIEMIEEEATFDTRPPCANLQTRRLVTVLYTEFDQLFLDVLPKAAFVGSVNTGGQFRRAALMSFRVVCIAAPLYPCAGRGCYKAPTECPRELSTSPGSVLAASPPHITHGTLLGAVVPLKDKTCRSLWSLAVLNRFLVPC